MNKSKKFFKIQISLCASSCIIDILMILRSLILYHIDGKNSLDIAATLCWLGAGLLSSIIMADYIRQYKKLHKK